MKWYIPVGILFLLGSFYWFEIRPTYIREGCANTVDKYGTMANDSTSVKQLDYELCIHEEGIYQ